MATITITGPTEIRDRESNMPITDPQRLKVCNGACEQSANLADDLVGDLAHLAIAGGDLKLRYDPKQKCVLVRSTYQAPRKLSADQLKKLIDYTRSQWSDGAGEGAFSKLLGKYRIELDITPSGSAGNTRAEQTDAGGDKLKPTAALAVAAEKGDIAKARRLLAGGADVNTRGTFRQTALQKAILHGHFQLAALLIDHGADVNAADRYGNTPLATAAMSYHLATVKRLIKAGAEVDRADKEGSTPLMWAASFGSAAIVQVLLEHGADPNAKDHDKYHGGKTPLMYADPSSKDVVELLVAHGAKPAQAERPKLSAVEHALQQAISFEQLGDLRQVAKWRKLAEQLKKYHK
jgi:ankyrin repeat protein